MTSSGEVEGYDVSVLVPSFNSSPHLEQAVRSALGQQGVTIEVLVQDGCSTDGSLDALKRVEDPRLKWVSELDDGQSDALNRALGRAAGEYVIWLNADDLLLPGAASALVASARKRGLQVVNGDYDIIDVAGRLIKPYSSAPMERARLLQYGTYIFSGALLIETRLLRAIGGFDSVLHYCMDYDLLLRLATATDRVGSVSFTVAQFRRQPDSKTETVWVPFLRERVRVGRRHGATHRQTMRTTLLWITYTPLRPIWRSRLWLRIRPSKRLGGRDG